MSVQRSLGHDSGGGPVLVIGMHRSGTSCLTGCLQEAGLELGEVNNQAEFNKKGNKENQAIMRLNDAVLAHNNGSWQQVPISIEWSANDKRRRDLILASYPEDRLWGFKDPRTTITLDGWLEALPNARLVGSVRHPWEVANSLACRNGIQLKRGLDLWTDYNRQLLRIIKSRPVLLVRFGVDSNEYLRNVRAMCRSLGLRSDVDMRFFEERYRVQRTDNTMRLSPAQLAIWEQLAQMSHRTQNTVNS
ncbi:MAG: sulfotransferase [Gammaproteobacteria bacterium]|nr:sulfotransferase [Gammaproteobacteria bacterium]MDH3467766.1 sulfotransferase [Gammaproteobacteria bacterium]